MTTEADATVLDKDTSAVATGDAGSTETTTTETKADTTETAKTETAFQWPDDWRDRLADGDEDVAKIISRYGSPKAVAKALKETKALVSSGKLRRDMPDSSDEKAMSEWRKENGIPDDPSGYKLPESVTKRVSDDDKPLLAQFTEYAHAKNAPQQVVDIAAEWYFDTLETLEAQRSQADSEALSACEDALRKDWAPAEYKANLTLAKRYMESVPEVGAAWTEARLPDGRRLGDIPQFVAWASDQGRDRFGDSVFANGDTAARHASEKAEIEKIMATDIDRYYAEGHDKKYAAILERETKRRK